MASAAATAAGAVSAVRSSSTGTPYCASNSFDATSESVVTRGVSVTGRDGSYGGAPALPVLVAQHAFQQLAGVGARQLRAQLVVARPLVVREARLGEGAQLAEIDRLPHLGLHDRVHALAPFVVGDAEHRRVEHLRMCVQHRFDLGGIDVDAAGDDHVLLAVADVDVTLFVDVRDVADRLP